MCLIVFQSISVTKMILKLKIAATICLFSRKGKMDGSAPTNPRQLIGRRFAKTYFGAYGSAEIYEGTVTAYTFQGLSGGYWHCSYDDGDEEEMLWEDLEQCLI